MLRILLLFGLTILVHGFNTEAFLKDHCTIDFYISTLTCDYVKFSDEENTEIQDTKFAISNGTFQKVTFRHCDLIANGALFEKFPHTFEFIFEDCVLDITSDSVRNISSHMSLSLTISSSTVNGNKGLKTLSRLSSITFSETYFNNLYEFFKQVPQLNSIAFFRCSFAVTSDLFQGLSGIQGIFIENNPYFTTLGAGIFSSLDRLQYLYLRNNQIGFIPCSYFPSSLINLFLNNNTIQVITENTFKNLRELRILDLGDNQIKHLSEKSLDNLNNLQNLQLRNNKIKDFTRRHLNGTNILDTLDISNNDIKDLSDETFDGLEYLNSLII